MALVTTIVHQPLERDVHHTEVECTFDIVIGADGRKYLQLDTYGSKLRQHQGKKSQSIRLTPEAISQLKSIIIKYGL